MAENKHEYGIIAIVAIIAVVGLVMIFMNKGTAQATYMPVTAEATEQAGNLGGQATYTKYSKEPDFSSANEKIAVLKQAKKECPNLMSNTIAEAYGKIGYCGFNKDLERKVTDIFKEAGCNKQGCPETPQNPNLLFDCLMCGLFNDNAGSACFWCAASILVLILL